ncbi:MAG: signal peptide peptidase SppA [Acidobacteriota bacterium]
MKKIFIGFLIGLAFCFLVTLLIGAGLMAAFTLSPQSVEMANSSVLVLQLEGDVPEQSPVDYQIPFLNERSGLTVVENWQVLKKAAADARIKAVVVSPSGLSVGWAKLEELRAQILDFKKSGKPVYAYLHGAGTKEYYVATAADQIFMPPDDWLDVKGLRAELSYYKNTLDKVGAAMEFEGIGMYKDAPDTYTKTSPSPQTLEITNLILDQYFGSLINVIAEGRKKQPADVRALIDKGPFVGQGAVDSGMIDATIFEDEMYDRLKAALKTASLKKVTSPDYERVNLAGFDGKGARVAVVTGDGEITGGNNTSLTGGGLTASGIAKVLRKVREDSTIQGVIVRIDSPGGDAVASAEILHEVKLLSAKKPTIISMSDYAASGGYMMAMTGDPILAYNNTLTGSIGVFFGKLTLRGFYDKIGLNRTLLTRGKWATIDSEYTPLSPDERARLHGELLEYYKGFVQRVADGRKQPFDKIEPLAQGRVWLGAQAKTNGLIDEIGGLDRAVEMMKQKAKIPTGDRVSLILYPERRSLVETLLNRDKQPTDVELMVDKVVGRLPWRALAHGGIMQQMPYGLDVK